MGTLPELLTDANCPAQAGDDAHVLESFGANVTALERFLSQWTMGDRAATAELVRETLQRASRTLDPVSADSPAVRPWLFTLARRAAIEFTRSARRRPDENGAGGEEARNAPSGGARPVLDTEVALALTRVSPEHRRVTIELFSRGRSVPETADLLGVSEEIVSRRGYHALRALRSAVGDHRPADA